MTSDREIVARLHGPARHLLVEFRALTEIQRCAIPIILSRTSAFLIAPTASGKTEAVICPLLELRARERWPGKPSILYVVPTRALVNDLYRRLEPCLSGYLDVGRRTAEHREFDCDLLLTTPESLDSMLARGAGMRGNHALAHVRAVVLDELHLLCESARGTQLRLLLHRVDVLTKGPVYRVALSATVADADDLARRFLGQESVVVSVGGGRAIRVERMTGSGPLTPRPKGVVDPLAGELWGARVKGHPTSIPERLLVIRDMVPLKALVFVPSRARCDYLAAEMSRHFAGRCPVPVIAHHGSLSQSHREKAEEVLLTAPESVAIATATLELGIDIGDVNLVVLDGPPGSVSSLLQRIGRANRRENAVHLLPFAKNAGQACIFASMIRAAQGGELDPPENVAHYSVIIQQLASLFFQSKRGQMRRVALERIFTPVFGDDVNRILQELVECSWLRRVSPSVYAPSESLCELIDSPMRLHSNIGGHGNTIPLIDSVTGEPVAWVQRADLKERILLAGSSYKVVKTPEAYELRAEIRGGGGRKIQYAYSSVPTGRNALRHLCLGLGLPENALAQYGGRWIHFGGALYARLLNLAGVDSESVSSAADPREALSIDLIKVVDRNWERLERFCGFGPYHRYLPRTVRKQAVMTTVSISKFREWLAALRPCTLDSEQAGVLEERPDRQGGF